MAYTPFTQRLKDRILEDEKDWKIQQMLDHATQVGQEGQAHTTQSTPEWCKDDSPEGGRVYTPGLYDEDRDDEIPDIATLRVTDNEEEEEKTSSVLLHQTTHTPVPIVVSCLRLPPHPRFCSKTRRHKHNPPHKLPANPNPATKNDTKKWQTLLSILNQNLWPWLGCLWGDTCE